MCEREKKARERVNRTLFILRIDPRFLVAQIHVDDIVFGSTLEEFTLRFIEEMKKEFEIRMVSELIFFIIP